VFLNGWNLGQYINDIGPQHDFVLPAGLLRSRGGNTLALAVIAQDAVTPGAATLVSPGTVRGGVPVENVVSPPYGPRTASPRLGREPPGSPYAVGRLRT
jgi:hypothetical protein